MEMVRGPRQMEERRTVDSPILSVCEAGTIETVVFRRTAPDCWRVLLGDSAVMEIWSVGRGEEPDNEE